METQTTDLQRIFNRHLGKLLTLLDAAQVPPELKSLVKERYYFLRDDVKEYCEGNNGNRMD